MKSLLLQIDLRFILRTLVIAMMGMQLALIVIFLEADQMAQASSAFTLFVWMFLALMFEGKAHNLKEEKEGLIKFLNTPPSETKGKKPEGQYKNAKPSRF
jgi:hypothetical protein